VGMLTGDLPGSPEIIGEFIAKWEKGRASTGRVTGAAPIQAGSAPFLSKTWAYKVFITRFFPGKIVYLGRAHRWGGFLP